MPKPLRELNGRPEIASPGQLKWQKKESSKFVFVWLTRVGLSNFMNEPHSAIEEVKKWKKWNWGKSNNRMWKAIWKASAQK